MALRSLDNAIPTAAAQERPRKVAKVDAVPPTATANDENAPPAPKPPGEASLEYVASEDLRGLDDPDAKIEGLLEELDCRDWTRVCEVLNDVRRLALHHPSHLLPLLNEVMLVMVKAMKNPRSGLCKTSIMACADIFVSFGKHLLPSATDDGGVSSSFDQLLLQLLLKASQDKRFVCEEAERSLKQMAGSVPPIPLLEKLQGFVKHSNLKVRAKAAVSISNCVSKMNTQVMREFGLANLLKIAAELLIDRLPEAREAARSIAITVREAFSGENDGEKDNAEVSPTEESWQQFCSSSLPPISAQSVLKITHLQQ